MKIQKFKGKNKKYIIKIRGRKTMAVSMGVLPFLKKGQAEVLLKDMEESKLKIDIFKDCKDKLKKILDEEGL